MIDKTWPRDNGEKKVTYDYERSLGDEEGVTVT